MPIDDIDELKEIRYTNAPIIDRDVLEEELEYRYAGDFDPLLIRWRDGGDWHYPVTSEETLCGKSIPDWVIGDNVSNLLAPSTALCSECGAASWIENKRGVKRLIERHVGFESSNRSGSWSKADLLQILEYIETSNGGAEVDA